MTKQLPEVINIMASSVDGGIARHTHESTGERISSGFTNETDQERLRELVAECGAVFIGWRSLRAEQGVFRVSRDDPGGKEPMWIIFTHTGDIDFSHGFWLQRGIPKSIFFCHDFSLDSEPTLQQETHSVQGENVVSFVGNLAGLLHELSRKNISRVALLGGGRLNALFWEHRVPSKLYLTLSPVLLGNASMVPLLDSLRTPCRLTLVHHKKRDGLLFLEYAREDSSNAP